VLVPLLPFQQLEFLMSPPTLVGLPLLAGLHPRVLLLLLLFHHLLLILLILLILLLLLLLLLLVLFLDASRSQAQREA